MTKLNKTAKALDTFFRIVQIIAYVALVAVIVSIVIMGAALLFNFDSEMIGTGYDIVSVGPLELTLAESVIPADNSIYTMNIIVVALCAVAVIPIALFIKCIRAILAPMIEGKPFHSTISVNLKKLAWYEIALGIIGNIIYCAESVLMLHFYNIPSLFTSSVTHIEVNPLEMDMGFLVIAGILFLLSYIFHYGEELQQLSDETL